MFFKNEIGLYKLLPMFMLTSFLHIPKGNSEMNAFRKVRKKGAFYVRRDFIILINIAQFFYVKYNSNMMRFIVQN